MSGAADAGAAGALRVRPVEEGDYERGARRLHSPAVHDTPPAAALTHRCRCPAAVWAGLLKLLAQLTVVGDVSRDAFVRRVRDMAAGPEHVLVVQGARCVQVHAQPWRRIF
jgi:hypothetical protein